MPDVICLSLKAIDGLNQLLTLLFDEAFGNNCGRHVLINRLFEVVLIQVLRHFMETGNISGGMLAGLSLPKLRIAFVAIHEQPRQEWSLDALARGTNRKWSRLSQLWQRSCTIQGVQGAKRHDSSGVTASLVRGMKPMGRVCYVSGSLALWAFPTGHTTI